MNLLTDEKRLNGEFSSCHNNSSAYSVVSGICLRLCIQEFPLYKKDVEFPLCMNDALNIKQKLLLAKKA